MSKLPYLPLFVGDQIKDTRGLTLQDRAIYLEIEMAAWLSVDTGVFHGAIEDLQRMFSVLDKQLLEGCLDVLSDKGLILSQKNDGGVYRISVPWIWNRARKSAEMSERGKKGGSPKLKSPAKAKAQANTGFIFTTETKKKNKKESPKSIILPFESAEFAEVWQRWLDYRKESGKPYRSLISMQQGLKKLSTYPERVAIAMIEKSIENHWQGIFPLSPGGTYTPNSHAKSVTKDGTINRLNSYSDE